MCQGCGCQQFIKRGKKAILKQAINIVKELHLTPANVDDYEIAETISGLIVPFGFKEDEVYETASWVRSLHDDVPQASRREERYQSHVRAFRDIFERLPAKGNPKQIVTTYHQLEQLARELDEASLASLDAESRETIQAVNHVHDDRTRQARVKERYGL